MASKKHKKQQPAQSPDSYIRSGKARLLPIGECLINPDWKEIGMASIYISRKHVTGNVTCGVYDVDLLWKGVVETMAYFNIPDEDLKQHLFVEAPPLQIDYNTVHNIIYGAEAFAKDFDMKPHKNFELSRMILEEDDDRIPIIEIEFGKEGQPVGYDAGHDDNGETLHHKDFGKHPDPWREAREALDLEDELSAWTVTEWEEFRDDPESIDESELQINRILLYVFENCFKDKNNEPGLDWEKLTERFNRELFTVSSDVVKTDSYMPSDEEIILHGEAHEVLTSAARDQQVRSNQDFIKDLIKGIERWPDNRQLYNMLQNFYIVTGEEQKEEEVLKTTLDRFPTYLFARVSYANYMLSKQKPEQVPEIMGRAFTISDFYPNRGHFHESEIFSLFELWFEYFLKTNQLLKARFYRIQLRQHIRSDYYGMQRMQSNFEIFDAHCIGNIKLYLEHASENPAFRQGMIDTLSLG